MKVQEKEPLSPREVLCKRSQEKLQKSVSIVTTSSYDTFILCRINLSEYVKRSYIRPKYSPMVEKPIQSGPPGQFESGPPDLPKVVHLTC